MKSLLPQPFAQFQSSRAMAPEAKRANVFEIALPSTLCHRLDMIGVPEALAAVSLEPPKLH